MSHPSNFMSRYISFMTQGIHVRSVMIPPPQVWSPRIQRNEHVLRCNYVFHIGKDERNRFSHRQEIT